MVIAFAGSIEQFEASIENISKSDLVLFQDHVWNAGSRQSLERDTHEIASLKRSAEAIGTTLEAILNGDVRGHRHDQRKRELHRRIAHYIAKAVKNGYPLGSLAKKLMVRVVVVRACLNAGLQAEGDRTQFLRERNRCRQVITNYLSANPNASRSDISEHARARVTWLKLYDQEWFDSVLPARKRTGFIPVPGTVQEDRLLAGRLNEAVKRLLNKGKLPRLTEHRIGSEAGMTSRERNHVLKLPMSAAVMSKHKESAEDWWKRRLKSYISKSGVDDPVITVNRIKQEYHLPLGVPGWMDDFIREETKRQGFSWIPKRHPRTHANRKFTKSPAFRKRRRANEMT